MRGKNIQTWMIFTILLLLALIYAAFAFKFYINSANDSELQKLEEELEQQQGKNIMLQEENSSMKNHIEQLNKTLESKCVVD